jgi:cysteine desulfurase/selenocysteine lyase
VIKNIHPQDIGVLLDNQGIAVRTGHHCTEPLMKRFGIAGTVRASFAMYNTKEEVDLLVSAIKKAIKMLT